MNKPVIGKNGGGGKRLVPFVCGEQLLKGDSCGLGNLLRLFLQNRLSLPSGVHRGFRHPGQPRHLRHGQLLFLQSGTQICLWNGTGGSIPDARFRKILIEAVQVYRTDILNGQVPYSLICSLKQPPVACYGAVLGSGTLLQVDHIGGVFCEGLPVIQCIALFDTALKVRCRPLDGLFCLPCSHAGFWLVGHPVADTLSCGVKTAGNRDAVGGAGLAGDFFYCGHDLPPFL